MPRPPRFLPPNNVYHIITRGNNKNKIFKDEEDFIYYLNLLSRFKKDHPFELYHYCLMPNHVHKLLKTNQDTNLSAMMKKLNLAYFYHFKKKYGFSGHFWQDRFRSQLVASDEYLIQCGKYIELNPVRAGIVGSPENYPWSSYCYYSKGVKDKLITPDLFYQWFGKNSLERQKTYRDLLIEEVIFEKSVKRETIGASDFVYNANRKKKYHLQHPRASYRKNPD